MANGTPTRTDVVVVGGGLAGLSAARRLAVQGRSVIVLEARDRLGGRTCTVQSGDGTAVDVGGQWLGPTQKRALALVEELGLETLEQYSSGRKHLLLRGRHRTYKGTIPSLPPHNLVDLQLALSKVDRLARRVDTGAPWNSPGAAEWDGTTLATWMRRNVRTRVTREMFRVAVNAVFSAEPEELSLLHFLFYAASGGNFMQMLEIEGGAQQTRVVGGTQQLAERLAEAVREAGGEVRLETPVRGVHRGPSGAEVITDSGSVRCDRVVAAMAPPLAGRIDWQPELPPRRLQLMHRMPMGSVMKCIAIYERPFWRERGESGESVSDTGPMAITFDDSAPDGRHGALLGFVLGDRARDWGARGAQERRDAVVQQFTTLFGEQAARPVDYIEKDWCADPWSAGCYVAIMPPAVMTRYGSVLREPVGPVHWAGTETATVWNGYMDGAIQSGERAAGEILESATGAARPA